MPRSITRFFEGSSAEDDAAMGLPGDQSLLEEFPPTSPHSFHYTQRAAQFALRIINAAAPTYLLGPFIPPFGDPDKSTLETAVYAFNDDLGGLLGALVTKRDPTSGLKAIGGGSAIVGFGVDTSTKLLGLALSTSVGYGFGTLAVQYGSSLLQASNPFEHLLGVILVSPFYRAPLFGVIGLGLNGVTNVLGLKAWEYCIDRNQEEISNRPLHILQTGAGYTLRWFNAVVNSEMLLFNLRMLGHSFTFGQRLAIFMAVDVTHQVGSYLAFVPHPFDSLAKKAPQRVEDDDNEVSESSLEDAGCPSVTQQVLKNLSPPACATMAIYGVSYMIDVTLNSFCKGGELGLECGDDTLENRLLYTATPVAGLLMADFLIRQVAPLLVPIVKRCWGNLWSTNNRIDQEQSLVMNTTDVDSLTLKV